jgi:hypothetical protein
MEADGEFAYVDYRIDNNVLYLMHTFVPEKLRGRKLGDQLAKLALNYIQQNKITSKIYCPFITAFVKSHPEYSAWNGNLTTTID